MDSIGGYEKQYLVEPDPVKLQAFGVSFTELAQGAGGRQPLGRRRFRAARRRGLSASAPTPASAPWVRSATRWSRHANGVPVAVKDLAVVRVGGDLRTGAASRNGHEVVVGTALMLIGQNSRTVAAAVGAKLARS